MKKEGLRENNRIKVSVILPSLNVRPYIEECMESVVNQTLKEIEIICVDAGSTDGTLEILREYEKQDSRVKVIVSDKKSYGRQMNIGVDAAKGEYIGIVETDDYVLPRMYEELYTIAKDFDVDFVKSSFYRFTGNSDERKFNLIRLTNSGDLYNRVIDVAEEQRVFQLVMNTWSGIYKREYLTKHDIRHNETPGASYQDNGFYFQTFMHAKRAYFYDEPYYMNRRDNENSSVYNQSKVYCMCDEYDYIREKLEKSGLYSKFRFTYTSKIYWNYKTSLERMAPEHKREFLQRFAKDLKRQRDEGSLDFRMFNEVDWEKILSIMEDPDRYWKEEIDLKDNFYKSLKEEENIIIYGTGMVGNRTQHQMTYRNDPIPITSFAVTKLEGRVGRKGDVPIQKITDLLEYREKALVIIAVTTRYQAEIKKTLDELGFKRVVLSPEANNEMPDYKAMTIDEKGRELKRWYRRVTGKVLDLSHPTTFNEKQQWLKLYDVTERKKQMADRILARAWVKENLGEKYLIPLYGVYEDTEEISLDDFPKDEPVLLQLSNGVRMSIKKEKYTEWGKLLNIVPLRRFINGKMKENAAYERGFDLVYDGIKPRVLMEKIIGEYPLDNYKFLCFAGVPRYVVFDSNKFGQMDRKRDIFDMNWQRLDAEIKYPRSEAVPLKPEHFDEMKEVAKTIAAGFTFSVAHLFDTEDGVLFNEVKFTFGDGVEAMTGWLDEELNKAINTFYIA